MNKKELVFKIASTKSILIKAIKIAFVVGIILNLINQGNIIFSLDFESLNIFKLLLTFLVPFCVSMYTAITIKLQFHVGDKVSEDIVLKCKACNTSIKVNKNQLIPFCNNCKNKTLWSISSIKD